MRVSKDGWERTVSNKQLGRIQDHQTTIITANRQRIVVTGRDCGGCGCGRDMEGGEGLPGKMR
jgi:hypothetical protein